MRLPSLIEFARDLISRWRPTRVELISANVPTLDRSGFIFFLRDVAVLDWIDEERRCKVKFCLKIAFWEWKKSVAKQKEMLLLNDNGAEQQRVRSTAII